MKYKAIVTDLDGTLLRDDGTVSQYTSAVLARCRRLGVRVVIATARSEFGIREILPSVQPDAVIVHGGALVLAGGASVFSSLMPADKVRRLIDGCLKLSEGRSEVTVQTESGYYWNYRAKPDPRSEYGNAMFTDFALFDHPAYTVTAQVDDEQAALRLAQQVGDCSVLSFRGENWRRFALMDSTKENGILALCAHFGIKPQEVIAFGDDYNDLGMMKLCGLGAAVGNALDCVREAADVVTGTNNEDGEAVFLEKIFGGDHT